MTSGKPNTRKRCIHLLEYSHLDWAWTFSRDFHRERYAMIFDEALELAERDPSFCFFVDSYAESLHEYFDNHPERIARWRNLLTQGRIAIVGGHFANLRPATAPEETYIRNLVLGRQILQFLFSDWEPLGLANMDTAIGHSQIPHILSLAGLKYYLAGRPELGLEQDGLPKLFRWQGQGGGEIVTCVQHYGILVSSLRKLEKERPEREEGISQLRELLRGFDNSPLIPAFFAGDDTRFRRDGINDTPLNLVRIRKVFSAAFSAEVLPSTPDRFIEALDTEDLPVITGPVDHGDVGYNGPFGTNALQALRDEAAARLVEAEQYLCFNKTTKPPQEDLDHLWRETLTAQTHAAQFLFANDLDALRLRLQNVIATANQLREKACGENGVIAIASEPRQIAIHSSSPLPRREIVAIHILATDFQTRGFELQDDTGQLVPQQTTAPQHYSRPGEWDILAELEVKGCGTQYLNLIPTTPKSFPQVKELLLDNTSIVGETTLHWNGGLLTGISVGENLFSADSISFLEPFCCPITLRGWMTTAVLPIKNRFVVDQLRQLEFGPLRWRFRRRGRIGIHILVQEIDVFADGRIDCQTEIHAGSENCLFALRCPCVADSSLSVSIPFGVEERRLETVHDHAGKCGDRVIERQIPGIFFARDWARFKTGNGTCALVTHRGDRYWRRPPGQGWIEHHLLRVVEPYETGWERHAAMDRPGYCHNKHSLLFATNATPENLDTIADETRFPLRPGNCPNHNQDSPRLNLHCPSGNLRLLACRQIDNQLEIRVVENQGQNHPLILEFNTPILSAKSTDLHGRLLGTKIAIEECRLIIPSAPREIHNLRLQLQD